MSLTLHIINRKTLIFQGVDILSYYQWWNWWWNKGKYICTDPIAFSVHLLSVKMGPWTPQTPYPILSRFANKSLAMCRPRACGPKHGWQRFVLCVGWAGAWWVELWLVRFCLFICCHSWDIFVINIMKRIAPKLHIIILLHLGLRSHFSISLWGNPKSRHFHDYRICGRVHDYQNQVCSFLETLGYLK